MQLHDAVRYPAFTQPHQIAKGIFAAGQNHQIGPHQLFRLANIAHTHIRLRSKRIEIRKVRNVRDLHNGDVDVAFISAQILALLQCNAIFIFQINIQPWHHAQHRNTGQRFNLLDTGVQQRHITAKLIDDHPFYACAFVIVQQRQRAVNGGEYPTTIDIRHQNDRALRHFCHAHIDDIAIAQVNLCRAPRTFQHQHIELLRQAVIN